MSSYEKTYDKNLSVSMDVLSLFPAFPAVDVDISVLVNFGLPFFKRRIFQRVVLKSGTVVA